MGNSNGQSLLIATRPVVCALLDDAVAKGYHGGVLGVHSAPKWDDATVFNHRGRAVRVVPCPSTLAVWEALRERDQHSWLVLLTPQDNDGIGAGALSHLIWHRLRTPDPWHAVQQRFAAASLDPALYQHAAPREVAAGLLAAMPEQGWPPAPGGVLTRDHAFDSVVRAQLSIVEHGLEVDVTAVMEWSLRSSVPAALADMRTLVGNPLTDAVIDWLAQRCGPVGGPIRVLVRAGRVADLVPLGLVAGLLNTEEPAVARAVGKFEGAYGLGRVSPEAFKAWHDDAVGLVTQTLSSEARNKVVSLAVARMRDLDIDELAETSDLFPAGLRTRLVDFAHKVRDVVPCDGAADEVLDRPLVKGDLLAVEHAWGRVREHHLATADDTVRVCEAMLRLVRWLSTDATSEDGLGALIERQVAADAWVDSAVNDALSGSVEAELAVVIGDVLRLVRARRDAHDRTFGEALAQPDEPDELVVERLLPEVIVPLAHAHPVLLIVVDGLSVAMATELVSDATRWGWLEHALPGREHRVGALAVLPTVTEFSRCSLLCGELRQGNADQERRGFAHLLRRTGLGSAADVAAHAEVPLFHQKDLDTVIPGQALATRLQAMIEDTQGRRLVAAVLNTVDDTLHHADPAGTQWTLSTVRHLLPLIKAARRADRTVVITSDHGHVIERRDGELQRHEATYGARARADGVAGPGEVRVSGPRVLTAGGAAVLAVNERIRYGSLSAGYHGGGAPAEAVVPVVVLHTGEAPTDTKLLPLDRTEPLWWHAAPTTSVAPTVPREATKPVRAKRREDEGEPLFDVTPPTIAPAVENEAAKLARTVVKSTTFKQQRSIAGRIPVTDEKITALLTALLAAPDGRIPAQEAAGALSIAVTRLRGALPLLKRILDVEGYVVLSYEPESGDVALDERMLREQFGVGS